MAKSESITFNGNVFRRYPDSRRWPDRVYYTPGGTDRARGLQRLHQEIWKAANGPIPPGHHIHHRDENPLNNSLDNLICVTGEDHCAGHAAERVGVFPEWLAAVHDEALAKAAEWHRSDEGRQWHREHAARQGFGHPDSRPFTCEQCGAVAQTRTPDYVDRFCSNNCKSEWRRRSGVDNEDRTCPACNGTFTVNRYAKKRCCSRKCAWVIRRRTG